MALTALFGLVHRRRTAGAALALASAVGLVWFQGANFVASGEGESGSPASWVFVTEDNADASPGCDAVSAFVDYRQERVFHGAQLVSPGRLAATSDGSLVVAAHTNGIWFDINSRDGCCADLYVLRRSGGALDTTYLVARSTNRAVPVGDVAVTLDDRFLLVSSEEKYDRTHPCFGNRYHLAKYAIDNIDWIGHDLGEPVARLDTGSPVAEILLASDGRTVHLVTVPMASTASETGPELLTIDAVTMRETAPRVGLPDDHVEPNACRSEVFHPLAVTHAALSPDDRYVVVSRWRTGELTEVDVQARSWRTLQAPGLARTAGVAFDRSGQHPGLLAVHGVDAVGVYEWTPTGLRPWILQPVARPGLVISAGDHGPTFGPVASLAWSASGDRLIAASSSPHVEFVSWRIGESGLVDPIGLEACSNARDYQNDILTLNGRVPQPTATPSATTTLPPSAPPATPTHTLPPTVIPRPSATRRPTQIPGPIYLPLMVREERCVDRQRVDVALVLDTSSSMADLTATGRPKIDVARDAAGEFIELLGLDDGDQAGLITFNDSAHLVQGLTSDRTALHDALAGIQLAPNTRIHEGVRVAHSELVGMRHRSASLPVLVLLTDGRSNPDPAGRAVDAAAAAKADGITIFTIGLGTDLDAEALQAMATRPEYFYHSPHAGDLAGIYRGIAVSIPGPASCYWPRR